MIQIPAQANVVLMHEPVNFRKGIDGMAAVARLVLNKEPMLCVGGKAVGKIKLIQTSGDEGEFLSRGVL